MMKIKNLLLIALFCVSLCGFAQRVPDYAKIEEEVINPSSQYYYPLLMQRYVANDTTLTVNDFYHLYYGYTFQESYKPLIEPLQKDSLASLFATRTTFPPDVFDKIERYSKVILSVEPFNLRDINVLAFAYQNAGLNEKAEQMMFKLEKIVEVIKSTGDGLSEKSPWWVIYRHHSNDLLSVLDIETVKNITISKNIEYLQIRNRADSRIKGYFFNISGIYNRSDDYINEAEQPKRKLEIKK